MQRERTGSCNAAVGPPQDGSGDGGTRGAPWAVPGAAGFVPSWNTGLPLQEKNKAIRTLTCCLAKAQSTEPSRAPARQVLRPRSQLFHEFERRHRNLK